tara:strand:- start:546 stop:2354 length:1809 start_codon:yes stop_codon:yes gene_type:complete
MMKKNPKRSNFLSFVKLLISYHKYGLFLGILITIVASLLDTIALALVVPTLELLTYYASPESIANEAHSASNMVLNFTRDIFLFFNFEYTLKWMLLVIFIIMGMRAISVFMYNGLMNFYKTKIVATLSKNLYRKLEKSSWVFYKSRRHSETTNLMTGQPLRVGSAYVDLTEILANSFNVLVYLIASSLISVKLTIFAVVAAFFLSVVFYGLRIIARILGEKSTIYSAELLESVGNSISMAKFIRSHGLAKVMREKVFVQLEKVRKNQFFISINEGIFHATYEYAFIILILSGLLVATRFMDLPTSLVLLMSLLLYRIFQKIKVVQAHLQRLSKNLPALDAIQNAIEISTKEKEDWGTKEYKGFKKSISLKSVYVNFDENQIIKNIDLEIELNSTVAFIGPSGGGKTTLADIISGLIRPDSGKVLVDGENLYQFSEKSWKEKLAYVSQGSLLFNDSIKNNLLWGNEYSDEKEMIKAARSFSTHKFVNKMPEKYDTKIGDVGSNLSGGERQRLVLTRAMLRKPRILILDEATSELDSNTQSEIVSSLKTLKGKITLLIIAHRLETISIADKVYFIDSGNISEILDPIDTITKESKMKELFSKGN